MTNIFQNMLNAGELGYVIEDLEKVRRLYTRCQDIDLDAVTPLLENCQTRIAKQIGQLRKYLEEKK